MSSYLRFDGATLPGAVGRDEPNGSRISDGQAGHLCFGPYFSLDPGNYVAGFYLRALPGSAVNAIDFDVYIGGDHGIARKSISTGTLFEDTPTFVAMEFEVGTHVEGAEVRAYVHNGVLVEITELVIFSTRARNWSGK